MARYCGGFWLDLANCQVVRKNEQAAPSSIPPAKLSERLDLLRRRHPGDDVTGHAAQGCGFCHWQPQLFHHGARYRSEGVAIVEAEGCHAVALPTEVHGLHQAHGFLIVSFPERLCSLITILGRFVQGVFDLTK